MRTLKLQVQLSLDGFVAGPNGEMDWAEMNWGEDINNYITGISADMDTVVLGRKLAEGFIPYWKSVAEDPDNPEVESGKLFTNVPKVVFSKSLKESKWDNTTVANGDISEEINKLKAQDGKNIFAYGGATFVSHLIKNDLVDEYYLLVNPTAIGKGMPIFDKVSGNRKLKLVESNIFDCGIVALKYKPVR